MDLAYVHIMGILLLAKLNQFYHSLLVQSLEINELSKCSARMCSNMSSLIFKNMFVIPKQYQMEIFFYKNCIAFIQFIAFLKSLHLRMFSTKNFKDFYSQFLLMYNFYSKSLGFGRHVLFWNEKMYPLTYSTFIVTLSLK